MAGGSVEEESGGDALVLERRGSWLVAVVIVATVGVLGAFLLAGSGDDAAPSTTTESASASSTVTGSSIAEDDGPSLTRLAGADSLPQPIWLLAGRSRSQNTMLLHRVDGEGEDVVNAPAGREQLPGEAYRAIRADDAIVWSNGDDLFRIDDDLSLIPFTLDTATAVFPSTDERVWTVDRDNNIIDSPLGQDRQPQLLGELPGELVAPLSAELFLVRFEGGVGIWIPGTETSYLATGLLATTPELTVFNTVRTREGALVVATSSPFTVTETVPLDVDGVPLGDGALSPDREHVAFHLQRGTRVELVVAEVATGETELLGVFTDRTAPLWLDDGRLVAVGAPTGGRRLVWLVSPGTSEPNEPIIELDAGRAWTLAIPTR